MEIQTPKQYQAKEIVLGRIRTGYYVKALDKHFLVYGKAIYRIEDDSTKLAFSGWSEIDPDTLIELSTNDQ